MADKKVTELIDNSTNILFDMKNIQNITYTSSHFLVATILVLCLKNINPLLLTGILFALLGYISYYEIEELGIPKYLLLVCGFIIYIIEQYVINGSIKFNCNTLWKIPYWGIIMYYLFYSERILKIIPS
jgi:hypothetical protein